MPFLGLQQMLNFFYSDVSRDFPCFGSGKMVNESNHENFGPHCALQFVN
jgi:hypothetical protein